MRVCNRGGCRLYTKSFSQRCRGLLSLCRVAAVLAACVMLAPSAFAGGGIGGLCPGGPCVELVAVAVNGNPIAPTSTVTVQPGDEIETNLFISGWGEELGPLRSYTVGIVWAEAAESGTRGTVLPFGWDGPAPTSSCNSATVCPIGSFCELGICRGPNHDPDLAGLIDSSREDFIFGTLAEGVRFVILRDDTNYEFAVVVPDDDQSAVDTGSPKYAGTFFLRASEFACGDFAPYGFADIHLTGSPFGPTVTSATEVPMRVNVGGCDCNTNGTDDLEEIASGASTDCNGNNVPDECERDCQSNGIADECDIAAGTSIDCDFDIIPDECEATTDCNNNGIRDECEVVGLDPFDCDGDGIPDDCGGGLDCNGNGALDSCDLDNDFSLDCQSNGVPDECDIASGFSRDDDTNGVPDECETFCAESACGPGSCVSLKAVAINGDPIEPTSRVSAARGDVIETEIWLSCWGADLGLLRAYQAVLDGIDAVASGDAGLVLPVGWDAPLDFTPCDSILDCPIGTDCRMGQCVGPDHFPRAGAFIDTTHENYVFRGFGAIPVVGTTTLRYLLGGVLQEITGATDTGQPKYGGTLLLRVSDDACGEFTFDFVPPHSSGRSEFLSADFHSPVAVTPNTQPLFIETRDCDCNDNGVLDDEELASGAATDCNSNSLPDDCDPDCDGNGIPDDCELADCNGDRACRDCNENGIPDGCDIASGTSTDIDGNGVPDDCFIPIPTVSEWGLTILALLLLVIAKLRFGFARSPAA